MSHGYSDAHDPPYAEEMAKARARVKAACDAENIAFLDGVNPDNVAEKIEAGVRVGSGGEEVANIGRKYTNRTMPW